MVPGFCQASATTPSGQPGSVKRLVSTGLGQRPPRRWPLANHFCAPRQRWRRVVFLRRDWAGWRARQPASHPHRPPPSGTGLVRCLGPRCAAKGPNRRTQSLPFGRVVRLVRGDQPGPTVEVLDERHCSAARHACSEGRLGSRLSRSRCGAQSGHVEIGQVQEGGDKEVENGLRILSLSRAPAYWPPLVGLHDVTPEVALRGSSGRSLIGSRHRGPWELVPGDEDQAVLGRTGPSPTGAHLAQAPAETAQFAVPASAVGTPNRARQMTLSVPEASPRSAAWTPTPGAGRPAGPSRLLTSRMRSGSPAVVTACPPTRCAQSGG